MSELSPRSNHELEPENEAESAQPELDKEAILNRLFKVKDRLGLEVEEEDLKDLLGEDDNDFLGNLTSLLFLSGSDLSPDDLFRELSIPTVYIIEQTSLLEIEEGNGIE